MVSTVYFKVGNYSLFPVTVPLGTLSISSYLRLI